MRESGDNVRLILYSPSIFQVRMMPSRHKTATCLESSLIAMTPGALFSSRGFSEDMFLARHVVYSHIHLGRRVEYRIGDKRPTNHNFLNSAIGTCWNRERLFAGRAFVRVKGSVGKTGENRFSISTESQASCLCLEYNGTHKFVFCKVNHIEMALGRFKGFVRNRKSLAGTVESYSSQTFVLSFEATLGCLAISWVLHQLELSPGAEQDMNYPRLF